MLAQSINKFKKFRLLNDVVWKNKKRNVKIVKQLTICSIIYSFLLYKRKQKKTFKFFKKISFKLLSIKKKKKSKCFFKIKKAFYFYFFLKFKLKKKIKTTLYSLHRMQILRTFYSSSFLVRLLLSTKF